MSHAEAVYERLGVRLTPDDIRGESAYNDDLPNVVADLEKAGLLAETKVAHCSSVTESFSRSAHMVVEKTPEGYLGVIVGMPALTHSVVFAGIGDIQLAKCVFLPEFVGKDGSPLPFIIQKSDEGYLYATTDLAAIRYRVGTLRAGRILYVVDARQALHFRMLFAVARKAGFAPQGVSLEHIGFGTMMGPDGKPFKTRTGGTVKLMDLLNEAVDKALGLVTQKNREDVAKGRANPLSDDDRKNVARAVGIGAVKYADLSQNRNSDYVFAWDKMLSLDGNTAPYMQYAYARVRSIYRKGGLDESHAAGAIAVADPAERILAVRLLQFPEAVATVAAECLPNVLCAYLYDLAGAFTTFYESCPVLKSEELTRASRLALCALTARTIRKGLELLGIGTIEQM
jgi:arginyl-tRNA synthetase